MEQSQFLDADILREKQENNLNVEALVASGGKRFGNLIIDWILIQIINFAFNFVIGIAVASSTSNATSIMIMSYFVSFVVYISYYTFFEATTGRTIGKYATNTRVVTEDGGQITFGQALGRSVARIIPFEPFSFLGSDHIGWHDTLSKTRVIEA